MAAQEPHKSAFEGVLRDVACEVVHKAIKTRGIEAQHVYPQCRHNAFKRLKSGREPDQFSLSAMLRYAEVFNCRPAVHRAICATAA